MEWGGSQCPKRFKRLGLTQLNVSNSLFVFGSAFLRSADVIPTLILPASAAAHPSVRANFMVVAEDVESENFCVCGSERDGDTVEHRDTACCAVSPSGGLIFSMGSPA